MKTTHTQEAATPEAPWDNAHESKGNLARRKLQESTEKLRHATDEIAESASEFADKAGDRYRETTDAAKRQYHRLSDQANEAYYKSKSNVQDSFNEHPIAYLAGTFAVGLALGLALPRLSKERRTLEGAGRRIRERADHVKEQAGQAARAARDTARSALEEKGLDPESVSESLKDVGEESYDSAKQEFKK